MSISKQNNLEKAVIHILNLDGWDLEWCGGGFDHYDAVGETPKGAPCIMEIKFRNKYYKTKMLEAYKYEKLMAMPEDMVKLYFVNDPKANYIFWLNNLDLAKAQDIVCPSTTLWDNTKKNKSVYLLQEEQASIININSQ